MDQTKKDKMVKTLQTATVVIYVLMVLNSTVGKYIKETKKNIKREAKRKDKRNKAKHKLKMKRLAKAI